MRNDNILSRLSEQQKDDLFAWLSDLTYAEVEKRLAEPPPAGFGLKVHRTTLRRFYYERLKTECDAALDSLPPDHSIGPRLLDASSIALAYSTYNLSQSPCRPEIFNQLSRALYRERSQQLKRAFLTIAEKHASIAEQRLEIERHRLKLAEIIFRFNASKQVAMHALEIKDVLKSDAIDTEQKVWQVSDIVFGPSPDREKFASCSPNPTQPSSST